MRVKIGCSQRVGISNKSMRLKVGSGLRIKINVPTVAGNFRITEDNEFRLTEDGDLRILE